MSDITNAEAQAEEEKQKVTKSATEVASEVLAGLWGRGLKRKERLEAAGHNPDKVQKEVDKLRKGK